MDDLCGVRHILRPAHLGNLRRVSRIFRLSGLFCRRCTLLLFNLFRPAHRCRFLFLPGIRGLFFAAPVLLPAALIFLIRVVRRLVNRFSVLLLCRIFLCHVLRVGVTDCLIIALLIRVARDRCRLLYRRCFRLLRFFRLLGGKIRLISRFLLRRELCQHPLERKGLEDIHTLAEEGDGLITLRDTLRVLFGLIIQLCELIGPLRSVLNGIIFFQCGNHAVRAQIPGSENHIIQDIASGVVRRDTDKLIVELECAHQFVQNDLKIA